jgi:hypothetical protein
MSKPKQYQISTSTMLSGLQKLKLEPGDILVVNHPDTLHYLEGLGKVCNFIVPLVFAPQGIKSLKRQDLLNLLEQLDQTAEPPSLAPNERTAAPL